MYASQKPFTTYHVFFNISTTSLFHYALMTHQEKSHQQLCIHFHHLRNTYLYFLSNPNSMAYASSLLVLHDYVKCSYRDRQPNSRYCLIQDQKMQQTKNVWLFHIISDKTKIQPPKRMTLLYQKNINILIGIQLSENSNKAKTLHIQR